MPTLTFLTPRPRVRGRTGPMLVINAEFDSPEVPHSPEIPQCILSTLDQYIGGSFQHVLHRNFLDRALVGVTRCHSNQNGQSKLWGDTRPRILPARQLSPSLMLYAMTCLRFPEPESNNTTSLQSGLLEHRSEARVQQESLAALSRSLFQGRSKKHAAFSSPFLNITCYHRRLSLCYFSHHGEERKSQAMFHRHRATIGDWLNHMRASYGTSHRSTSLP